VTVSKLSMFGGRETLRETPSVGGPLTRAMAPNSHRSEKSRPSTGDPLHSG